MSKETFSLSQVKKLYKEGFAIHLLQAKSKRPIEMKWTTGKRKTWGELEKLKRPEHNVGVRLGSPSVVAGKYLAVIDCDVKSDLEKHTKEMNAKLLELAGKALSLAPVVASGRGNGSKHVYFRTREPVRPRRLAQSGEKVKVLMPSSDRPSNFEKDTLSPKEIAKGIRLRPAWEISLMGEGQQVVLPPSIHPDTGKPYTWWTKYAGKPPLLESAKVLRKEEPKAELTKDSTFSEVDLKARGVDKKVIDQIVEGTGISDRSGALLGVANSLYRAGLKEDEILSVLTNRDYFLGVTAFDHAKTTSRKKAADWVRRYTLEKSKRESSAEEIFKDEVEETVILSPKKAKAQLAEIVKERDWTQKLDRNDQGKLRASLRNLDLILTNTVSDKVFRRDSFAFRDFYGVKTPWGGAVGDALSDDEAVKMKSWFAEKWKVEPNVNLIFEVMTLIATRNAFHPVRDYLDSLIWDGTERVDTWLETYLSAKGENPYMAEISRKFLVAMVARAYRPGVKFDHTVVLEGAQGIGKSSAGRILAGEDWYLDSLPDLRDKDAALNLQGAWLVEMSELANLRQSEAEVSKAFLTRQTDKVRPPYGKRWVELKRGCVFLGTTNADTYLKDRTGNRRYWPIEVGQCDFKALTRDRDQLLAEAKWVFDNLGENLYLEGEAKIQAEVIQASRIVQDDSNLMAEALIPYFRKTYREEMKAGRMFIQTVRISSLFGEFGPLARWRYETKTTMSAGQALKALGFERYVSRGLTHFRKRIDPRGTPEKG